MEALKVVSLVSLIGVISCKNILFLNGIASPSHHLWNRVLIKGLAEKGHNITMVSVDDDKNPSANIHYIFMEATYEAIYGGENSMDLLEMADDPPLPAISSVYEWCKLCCDGILNSKGLEKILNYPNDFKFDAVIYDFTCGPCLLPLIHKFNYPPLIAVTAFSNPPYTHHLTGGFKFPALVPHYVIDYPQVMSFTQRFFNSLLYIFDMINRQYITLPRMEKNIRERFNFKDFPSLAELEAKTKVILVNSDNAVDFHEPLQPNMIQVGGLQITVPKQLPQELLNFIEGGKLGTVLMSLGTNMKSNMLGIERLTTIIKTFSELPQYNFVWKFESEPEELPLALPKNVFVSKFLPQNDILAHENIKAFITHSGLLSTQESMWYGRPMIGIPFFCDQKRTVDKSVRMGIAVKIDFRTLNVKEFKKAILTVTENTTYSENAKRYSQLFQDKQQRPLDLALWWIEYVIRNPSSPIYDSVSKEIGWIATNNYDVIFTLLVLVHVATFIIFKTIKFLKHLFTKPESLKLKVN